jgi:hypothetical protein
MHVREFARKLKKLNKNLWIAIKDNPNTPAGLHIVIGGEPIFICGVDKGELPRHTQWNEEGRIIKGGWFRVLKILLQRDLIDRRQTEKVFRTGLNFPYQRVTADQDPVLKAIHEKAAEIVRRGNVVEDKNGNLVPLYKRNDFMELGEIMQVIRR